MMAKKKKHYASNEGAVSSPASIDGSLTNTENTPVLDETGVLDLTKMNPGDVSVDSEASTEIPVEEAPVSTTPLTASEITPTSVDPYAPITDSLTTVTSDELSDELSAPETEAESEAETETGDTPSDEDPRDAIDKEELEAQIFTLTSDLKDALTLLTILKQKLVFIPCLKVSSDVLGYNRRSGSIPLTAEEFILLKDWLRA